MNQHEVRLALINHIGEMMFQMSDPDETTGDEETFIENYREFASHIIDSLRMEVLEADSNTYKVSLTPLNPESYVDMVLQQEADDRTGE